MPLPESVCPVEKETESKQNKTGGYLKVCFMLNNHFALIFQLSFWLWCNQSMWGITYRLLQGTDRLCYNSKHWVYLFSQFYKYSYNRSPKESAEWQAAIVLLKDKIRLQFSKWKFLVIIAYVAHSLTHLHRRRC